MPAVAKRRIYAVSARNQPPYYEIGSSAPSRALPVMVRRDSDDHKNSDALPRYVTIRPGNSVSHQTRESLASRHTSDVSQPQDYISISSDDPDPAQNELQERFDILENDYGRIQERLEELTSNYDKLLETVGKDMRITKDAVQKLVDSVLAHLDVPGSTNPTGGIPALPLEKDYPGLKHWKQGPWQTNRNGEDNDEQNIPTISAFLEDENGEPISRGVKAELRGNLFSYWNGVFGNKNPPINWKNLDLDAKEAFRNRFETKYSWLRLCEAHWKVDHLWINYFGSWKRSHGLSATLEPALDSRESSSAQEGTDDYPAGAKRKGKEIERDARDSPKRQKFGGFRAITPVGFHPPRVVPRTKMPMKLAKSSLEGIKVTASVRERSSIQVAPVASGSGTIRSTPAPPIFAIPVVGTPPTTQTLPVASGSGTTHSSPPPGVDQRAPATTPPSQVPFIASNEAGSIQAVRTLDTQAGVSLPEYYTSPIVIPPEITPISSVTASSDSPEPVEIPKKKKRKSVSHKALICKEWVAAGKCTAESFEKIWKNKGNEERKALIKQKKLELRAEDDSGDDN